MANDDPAFSPDAYVVRFGVAAAVGWVLGLVAWTVLSVTVLAATSPSVKASAPRPSTTASESGRWVPASPTSRSAGRADNAMAVGSIGPSRWTTRRDFPPDSTRGTARRIRISSAGWDRGV